MGIRKPPIHFTIRQIGDVAQIPVKAEEALADSWHVATHVSLGTWGSAEVSTVAHVEASVGHV